MQLGPETLARECKNQYLTDPQGWTVWSKYHQLQAGRSTSLLLYEAAHRKREQRRNH